MPSASQTLSPEALSNAQQRGRGLRGNGRPALPGRAGPVWLPSGSSPDPRPGGPVRLPAASGFGEFGCGTFTKPPARWGQIAEAAAGRDEGQRAAPGLGPGQRTEVRLTPGAPSSTPLPHQGLSWRVLGVPGLLVLWREREGGERRLPGRRERRVEEEGEGRRGGGEGGKSRLPEAESQGGRR